MPWFDEGGTKQAVLDEHERNERRGAEVRADPERRAALMTEIMEGILRKHADREPER